jgi:hypothetical protein
MSRAAPPHFFKNLIGPGAEACAAAASAFESLMGWLESGAGDLTDVETEKMERMTQMLQRRIGERSLR